MPDPNTPPRPERLTETRIALIRERARKWQGIAHDSPAARIAKDARDEIEAVLNDRAALLADAERLRALLRHAMSGCTGWVEFRAGAGSTTCDRCQDIRTALKTDHE